MWMPAAAALGVLVLGAGRIEAGEILHVIDYPTGPYTGPVTIPVPRFNPALGELETVMLYYGGRNLDFEVLFSFSNPSPVAVDLGDFYQGVALAWTTSLLQGPASLNMFSAAYFSQPYFVTVPAGGSATWMELGFGDTDPVPHYADAAQLSAFAGSGTVDFILSASVTLYNTPPFPIETSVVSLSIARGGFDLKYYYRDAPSQAVPEPGAWVALAMACAAALRSIRGSCSRRS